MQLLSISNLELKYIDENTHQLTEVNEKEEDKNIPEKQIRRTFHATSKSTSLPALPKNDH